MLGDLATDGGAELQLERRARPLRASAEGVLDARILRLKPVGRGRVGGGVGPGTWIQDWSTERGDGAAVARASAYSAIATAAVSYLAARARRWLARSWLSSASSAASSAAIWRAWQAATNSAPSISPLLSTSTELKKASISALSAEIFSWLRTISRTSIRWS